MGFSFWRADRSAASMRGHPTLPRRLSQWSKQTCRRTWGDGGVIGSETRRGLLQLLAVQRPNAAAFLARPKSLTGLSGYDTSVQLWGRADVEANPWATHRTCDRAHLVGFGAFAFRSPAWHRALRWFPDAGPIDHRAASSPDRVFS